MSTQIDFAGERIAYSLYNEYRVLLHRCLPEYLQRVYGVGLPDTVNIDSIYIVQISDGNIDEDIIGSLGTRAWMFNPDGLIQHQKGRLEFAGDNNGLYSCIKLKFFLDGNRILVSEAFGPKLLARRRGEVSMIDGDVVLKLSHLWRL